MKLRLASCVLACALGTTPKADSLLVTAGADTVSVDASGRVQVVDDRSYLNVVGAYLDPEIEDAGAIYSVWLRAGTDESAGEEAFLIIVNPLVPCFSKSTMKSGYFSTEMKDGRVYLNANLRFTMVPCYGSEDRGSITIVANDLMLEPAEDLATNLPIGHIRALPELEAWREELMKGLEPN
jgi:hypothetical protein